MESGAGSWHIEGDELQRLYIYTDTPEVGRSFMLRADCLLKAGSIGMINTFWYFLLSPFPLAQGKEYDFFVRLGTDAAQIPMRGICADDNVTAVLRLVGGPEVSRSCTGAFSRGTDLRFLLYLNGERMADLPMPNDESFWKLYGTRYDELCDANPINVDGFLKRFGL